MLSARFKRSCYLLFVGMWRGEQAIDTYDSEGLKALHSGRWSDNRRAYRVWWRRQQ